MLTLPIEERIARASKASLAAAAAQAVRMARDPYAPHLRSLRLRGTSALQRCTNPKCKAYADYGGRGIEFRFSSTLAFAEWVLQNLGPCPSPAHSIDRIDNNRHYEPGNLRWATRAEQNRNKRRYKRTEAGERIRALHALRPDLTYETLRSWVKLGRSDEEITQRRKYAGSGL